MAGGAILLISLSYPIFYLIETGEVVNVLIAHIIYGIAQAPVASILTTAITEMFSFATHCTGGAIGCNAALTITGGLTPIICQWIYHLTVNIYSLDDHITSFALVHLLFVLFSKETRRDVCASLASFTQAIQPVARNSAGRLVLPRATLHVPVPLRSRTACAMSPGFAFFCPRR